MTEVVAPAVASGSAASDRCGIASTAGMTRSMRLSCKPESADAGAAVSPCSVLPGRDVLIREWLSTDLLIREWASNTNCLMKSGFLVV